jgi:hypothetical protein
MERSERYKEKAKVTSKLCKSMVPRGGLGVLSRKKVQAKAENNKLIVTTFTRESIQGIHVLRPNFLLPGKLRFHPSDRSELQTP